MFKRIISLTLHEAIIKEVPVNKLTDFPYALPLNSETQCAQ